MVRLAITPATVVQKVGDESVLVNLDTGLCVGLDEIGTNMIELLVQHGQPDKILDALHREYEASYDELSRDLDRLIERSVELGLLELVEDKDRS